MKAIVTKSKRYQYLALLSIGILFCCRLSAKATSNNEQLLHIIEEAIDYSLVKPSHALTLLETNKALLENASRAEQYRYFETGFWASVSLYDSKRVSYFVEKMFETRNLADTEPLLSGLLRSLAFYYRLQQDHQSSINAAVCAIELSQTQHTLNRSIIPLGLTYFVAGEHQQAIRTFDISLALSEKQQNQKGVSAAKNNLAIAHIFTGEYQIAEAYLRDALRINEKMARANGTAINLANLLLVYYLQQDWQGVSRLLNRATRASKLLHNNDLEQYVFWLKSAFKFKTETNTKLDKTQLVKRYQQIKEPTVLKLLTLVAAQLEISLPNTAYITTAKKLDFAQAFPSCESRQNQDNRFIVDAVVKPKVKQLASAMLPEKKIISG